MTRRVKNQGKSCRSLGTSLENKLLAYAVSATAAGVGVLSLTQPADAKIIFTATHQTVTLNQSLKLDLNNDGTSDFTLTIFNSHLGGGVSQTGSNRSKGFVYLVGANNSDQAVASSGLFLQALGSNVKVSGSDKFFGPRASMAFCDVGPDTTGFRLGPWVKEKNKFLGVKFAISGQTHFGWVRLSVRPTGNPFPLCQWEALVTGYAYESTPGTSILTGQKTGASEVGSMVPDLNQPSVKATPSLGLLAHGAPGLDIWRREQDQLS